VAEDRGSGPFLLYMFGLTISGIVFLGTFTGILASGIERRLAESCKGCSTAVEEDLTVILGWSLQIFTNVSELVVVANGVSRVTFSGDDCIVGVAESREIGNRTCSFCRLGHVSKSNAPAGADGGNCRFPQYPAPDTAIGDRDTRDFVEGAGGGGAKVRRVRGADAGNLDRRPRRCYYEGYFWELSSCSGQAVLSLRRI